MTTKPKARKFRIRRGDVARPTDGPAQAAPAEQDMPATPNRPDAGPAPTTGTRPEELLAAPETPEDGFGDLAMPGSAAAARRAAPDGPTQPQTAPEQAPPPQQDVDQELSAIRAEGLTGRQLRMARRTAQKHGLSPTSDFDAIRLLRARGVDPFSQSNMLELVVDGQQGAPGNNLPAAAKAAPLPAMPGTAPRPHPLNADQRAVEIMKVQRDIARRRRRRLALLATRLAFFVLLPTLLVAYYYFRVATPLYATNTEFLIQKADNGASAGGGGLGGLLGGTSFATVTESISVQSFLESREAMLRLDEELDFRGHFSDPSLDPLARLAPDATVEQMFDTYRQHLTIGYDPTEGLVKMEVVAADPLVSQAFSQALIRYAEERVDQMSQRLRVDQMTGANESFEEAVQSVTEAQQRVLALQERRGVLSAEAEVSNVFSQIASFEMEVQQERLRLAEIQAASRPNATRVQIAEANIARLETLLQELRGSLTETNSGEASLARIQSELIVAQADLETRQMMLAQSLQSVESARTEANRQTLYLSLSVFPVAPDEAAYPRAFENTLLAFLIFSGIYLMVSMTAAILKEQVSS
jgi:capsular polysaccharide transport system permease protein